MIKQKSEPTKTVLTISVALIILYLITRWNWIVFSALAVGFIGIFSTYLSKIIDSLWMKLAMFLNFIMSNILLSIIFFLLLFPIAILSRVFRNDDPLNLKNKSESNFQNSSKKLEKISFEKPW